MLKTKRDYKYSVPPSSGESLEYRISPNDIIEFRIFTNNGFKLIDATSISDGGAGGQAAVQRLRFAQEYLVEHDGMIKLPILERVSVKGMTVREAERMLEELYAEHYIKPFILMNVNNRRVIVFPGQHGSARVVPLVNNNTTLLEALALSGGISRVGKAKRIKLIRGQSENPEVFLIDLSTIDGLKHANIVMQANDVIYVEPRLQITQGVVGELTPLISLITSALIIYSFTRRL
jgi:polysaccharide biosynthesis/export protein